VPSRTPIIDLYRPAVHAACRAYFRLALRGTEHIPAEGPVIIAPNHQTYADPPLVTIPVRRPVYYMAWSRLFDIPVFSRLIRLLPRGNEDGESALDDYRTKCLKLGCFRSNGAPSLPINNPVCVERMLGRLAVPCLCDRQKPGKPGVSRQVPR